MNPTAVKKPSAKRIIGIDYGMARIGVAASDEMKIIASPLTTVATEKKLENTAAKVIEALMLFQQSHRFEVEEIVIGMPLQMNGKMGMLADEVKLFVEVLKTLIPCPINTWDERLTTVQVERSMREGSMSRKKRSKVVDKVTATLILQNYLDSKRIGMFGLP